MQDFQREWVTLNGKSRALKGRAFRVSGPWKDLNTALEQVICAHGGSIAESGYGCHIFLNVPLAQAKDPAAKVLAVLPGAVPENAPEGSTVLYTPQVYGAGLRTECTASAPLPEDDTIAAVHAADFLAAVLKALKQLTPGVFVTEKPEAPLVSDEAGLLALRILEKYPDRPFYDSTAYGGQLRPLQEKGLELLLELDRICRQANIPYFLGGGTLLGAVRHQGFIPWDDDVDVMMTRAAFERFIEEAPKLAGEGFFFQSRETDRAYHSPFMKLRLEGTLFVTEFSSRFPYGSQGVFLDIFAHDAAPKAKWLVKPHIFLTTLARSLVFHKWAGTPMQFGGRLKWVCRLADRIVARCSIEKLEAFEKKVMTIFNSADTGYLYDGMGEHLRRGRFPQEVLEKTATAVFEGHSFPIPADYDQYLRFSYGEDYMQWPRPGLRRVHHSAVRFSLGAEERKSL